MQLKDGMLVFSNKKILRAKIQNLKDIGLDKASEQMCDIYEEGFLSFRPLILADNEEMIQMDLKRRSEREVFQNVFHSETKAKSDNPSELQEKIMNIVEDDEFASLLNENGEIQVGDSLYKFTESGMYFVHIEDKSHLYNYLEENAESINQLVSSLHSNTKAMTEDHMYAIDDKITRFAIEPSGMDDGYGEGGGGGSSYNPPNKVSDELREMINSWETTRGRETEIAGWFGDRRVTYAYISDHRRAKIIYTNQSFGNLWGKTAVIVKYQKKGTGIW